MVATPNSQFLKQPEVFLYSVLHGWTFLFFMTIDPLMLRVLHLASKERTRAHGCPHCGACGLMEIAEAERSAGREQRS